MPLSTDVSGKIHTFWQKTNSSNRLKVNTSLDVTMNKTCTILGGSNIYTINVNAPTGFSGIADVILNYDTKMSPDFYRSAGINYFIKVENLIPSYNSYPKNFYYIPIDKDVYYIPVPIENGTGQTRISIYPEKAAWFSNFSAVINAVYPNFEDLIANDKLHLANSGLKENQFMAANVNDSNWINGINANIILLDQQFSNYDQFTGKTIVASDGTTNTIQYAVWENNFTSLICEKPITKSFEFGNVFTIDGISR